MTLAKRAGQRSRHGPKRYVKPMLASMTEASFDRPGWFFEVKWDGYRAIAEVTRRGLRLYSRNQQPFEERFPRVVEAIRRIRHEAIFDGEIVIVDDQGRSQFQLLQSFFRTGRGQLVYYVFDLLELDGRDLRGLPLWQRKKRLRSLLKKSPIIRLSEHVEEDGIAFFEAAVAQGLEGIVAKDATSTYHEGVPSRQWLKIKTHRRQEVVIGGFTEPRGSRKGLAAVVLGVYEGDDLVFVGHSGGGLDTRGLAELRARLEPLVQQACPFNERPTTNAPVHWVKPELVCEVKFHEWTDDGLLRAPIFLGLREDKDPRDIRRERPRT